MITAIPSLPDAPSSSQLFLLTCDSVTPLSRLLRGRSSIRGGGSAAQLIDPGQESPLLDLSSSLGLSTSIDQVIDSCVVAAPVIGTMLAPSGAHGCCQGSRRGQRTRRSQHVTRASSGGRPGAGWRSPLTSDWSRLAFAATVIAACCVAACDASCWIEPDENGAVAIPDGETRIGTGIQALNVAPAS